MIGWPLSWILPATGKGLKHIAGGEGAGAALSDVVFNASESGGKAAWQPRRRDGNL
jgi:hypothetical protein